jgi:hypothetical protein
MGGRLGNWLFQYATSLGVAAHNGHKANSWELGQDLQKDLSRTLTEGNSRSATRHCFPSPCQQLARWKFDQTVLDIEDSSVVLSGNVVSFDCAKNSSSDTALRILPVLEILLQPRHTIGI